MDERAIVARVGDDLRLGGGAVDVLEPGFHGEALRGNAGGYHFAEPVFFFSVGGRRFASGAALSGALSLKCPLEGPPPPRPSTPMSRSCASRSSRRFP